MRSTTTPGPRSTIPAQYATPTPVHGSLMPKSPKPPTPLSVHQPPGDRAVDRAPRQRRPIPRRLVPGMAVSPVSHRLRRITRRCRYHPPPPRDHRNRIRRPHRRTPGTPAFRPVRRELGLDPVRRDLPQPAARGRRPCRGCARSGPRCHAAPAHRQHPSPPGPTPTPTHPAPTGALALGAALAHIVAQHHWIQPTSQHNPLTTRRKARPRPQEKLGRPAATRCPRPETPRKSGAGL